MKGAVDSKVGSATRLEQRGLFRESRDAGPGRRGMGEEERVDCNNVRGGKLLVGDLGRRAAVEGSRR